MCIVRIVRHHIFLTIISCPLLWSLSNTLKPIKAELVTITDVSTRLTAHLSIMAHFPVMPIS